MTKVATFKTPVTKRMDKGYLVAGTLPPPPSLEEKMIDLQ
jgi:hypothetical protein